MASTPKSTLDDGLIDGLLCAICGADALHVVHMDNLPDYVGCESCKSAFLSEDGGERVFYGKIGDGYPSTERFALKQWVWLEAVDNRAREERGTPELEIPGYDEPQLEEITPLETDVETLETSLSEIAADIPETPDSVDLLEERLGGLDLGQEAAAIPGYDEPQLEEITPLETEIETLETSLSEKAADTPEAPESVDLLEERLGGLDLGQGAAAIPGLSDLEQDSPDQVSGETDDLASYFRSITDDAGNDLEQSLPEDGEPPLTSGLWDDEVGLEPADEQALPGIADAQIDESFSESGDSWDQPIKETSETDEIPLPDWAQPADDSAESSLEGFAQEIETPIDNLQAPEEPAQNFLSDLRQSAGVPLESEPIPDMHVSEFPLESQPIIPQQSDPGAAESAAEPESFASRIESLSPTPSTDPEPIDKIPGMPEEPSQEPAAADAEVIPDDEVVILDTDPPPGYRYRIAIRGEKSVFPGGDCAHCGRTPVKGHLAVVGSLPDGQNITQRKPATFKIPLCRECRKRAAQLSDEAKEARLQTHLLSAIGGMLLVVGALALDLINPADLQLYDILILAILLIVGYSTPALFLLGRVGKHPPPASSLYVRSTLLVPQETQGLETAFEWRNAEYAERFFEANEAHALGKLSKIKDRAAPPVDLS